MFTRSVLTILLAILGLGSMVFAQTGKQLTISQVFWPAAGLAIETDDALSLSRWGVTETLLKVDYDGQIVPMLASSWEQVSPLEWVFNLREDVVFQNGEIFNAEAVVTALEYLIQSDTPPRGLDSASIDSIQAKAEFQISIVTKTEDALLTNRLVSPSFGILAPQAYTTSPPNPFATGTGPFILSDEVPEQSVQLIKHENYWNGKVQLDEVTFLATPDADTRATMLQTGEVDIAMHLPIPILPILEADNNLNIVRLAQPRTTTMYLNNASGSLADRQIRRAVLHAIDKEVIVAAVLEGVGQAAVGPFAKNEAWVNLNLTENSYNPETAKQLLKDAGFEEDELAIEIWTYPGRASHPPIAIVLQDMAE